MLPGWIASVKGYFISNKFIVPGKARVIDALIPVWIITEKEDRPFPPTVWIPKLVLAKPSSTLQVYKSPK